VPNHPDGLGTLIALKSTSERSREIGFVSIDTPDPRIDENDEIDGELVASFKN